MLGTWDVETPEKHKGVADVERELKLGCSIAKSGVLYSYFQARTEGPMSGIGGSACYSGGSRD